MIKSILIPTDGSNHSTTAAEYGIYLASLFDAEVTGLNVVDIKALEGPFLNDLSGSLGFSPYQNSYQKFKEILEQRSELVIENFKTTCLEKSIEPKTKKLTGIIPNIIAEEAKRFDLVIVSQRGEHAQWSSGLLGSTTESVVRKSSRPVLVTTEKFTPIKSVLSACDGSIESTKALKLACEFVYSLKLSLHVIIVSNDPDKGSNLISEADEFIQPYHIPFDIELGKGVAGEEILKCADKKNADLIIMGAFGHNRIHELILGGTTAFVMRRSPIPLLLNR